MNRFIYLFIVGLFICVNIAHSNSNTQTNHADSSITTPKHNYYQAFRDERFKSQNKPYDYNRMIGYNLLMSPEEFVIIILWIHYTSLITIF